MSTLHQMVLWFLLIQFVVVLMGLIGATRMADPQLSLPAKKSIRRVRDQAMTGSHN